MSLAGLRPLTTLTGLYGSLQQDLAMFLACCDNTGLDPPCLTTDMSGIRLIALPIYHTHLTYNFQVKSYISPQLHLAGTCTFNIMHVHMYSKTCLE